MMKSTSNLSQVIEKYFDFTIIVEGKKDVLALKSLGFKKIFKIHNPNQTINSSIEKIFSKLSKGEIVCILTDSDKRGRQLFSQIKKSLQIHGFKTDSSLRKILAKTGVSHIEGLDKFIANHSS